MMESPYAYSKHGPKVLERWNYVEPKTGSSGNLAVCCSKSRGDLHLKLHPAGPHRTDTPWIGGCREMVPSHQQSAEVGT